MAKMTLTSLARKIWPFLQPYVRKMVGDFKGSSRPTSGWDYRLWLIDQSEMEITGYVVYALGSGDYAPLYDVMVAASAGDVILIPPGTFQGGVNTADASTSDIAFVGFSRIATILDGGVSFDGGGGSVENLSLIDSYDSGGDISHIELYAAGTIHANDIHIEITQVGAGGVDAVSVSHADAIVHVWNSYIKANASGAGAGYAAYSDGEVHFHNCHLVYSDAIENPGGSGSVYLHGCSTETI